MLGIGVIPALSMQSVGFKITATVAYGVTIPAGCLLAFYADLSIQGLIWGACIGHVVQAVLYAFWILRADWYQISEETAKRIKEDEEKNEETLEKNDDNFSKV